MRHRTRKAPMSQINVVPYIDVMLVLLIIFMVTAPLITQGIKVDLPDTSAASSAADDKKPIIISVKRNGELYLNIHQRPDESLNRSLLSKLVAAEYKANPKTPILIRGDKAATHGLVTEIMGILQATGVEKIGIVTRTQHEKK